MQQSPSTIEPPVEGTYWVTPGRFCAGPYPGHHDPAIAGARLSSIQAAGIHHFVNLMFDHETGHDNQLFTPYEPLLATGSTMKRFSIEDVYIPSRELMVEILDHIDQHIDEGVYIHCWGGVGRTGTTVGCWLIRHGLVQPDSAIEFIANLRRADPIRGHRASPETREQRQFVTSWKLSL